MRQGPPVAFGRGSQAIRSKAHRVPLAVVSLPSQVVSADAGLGDLRDASRCSCRRRARQLQVARDVVWAGLGIDEVEIAPCRYS